MAQNPDERLLSLLEPQADVTLPKGWTWGKPAHMAIAGPAVKINSVRRGGKMVLVPDPESLKRAKAFASMRWPVLDRTQPEAALEIWQAHSLEVHAAQEKLRAPKVKAAAPAPERPMPIRIIRI